MPDVKLDTTRTKRQLYKTPSIKATAAALQVHPSTISRFVKKHGLSLVLISDANEHGMAAVVEELSSLGLKNKDIARKLAVSPALVSQILK